MLGQIMDGNRDQWELDVRARWLSADMETMLPYLRYCALRTAIHAFEEQHPWLTQPKAPVTSTPTMLNSSGMVDESQWEIRDMYAYLQQLSHQYYDRLF